MSKFKPINNPHSHSSASLDGAATVSSYVKHAKANGIQYLTFTEHGNMDSAMDLYVTAKKAGIKPVLGIELYMQPPFLDEISKEYLEVEDTPKMRKKLRELYVHLTVHFKDEWAFEYFSSLTPKMEERAVVRWGERKPIATIEEVAAASGHIVICSSCFVPGTKVKTKNGLKSIENIKEGDIVYNRFGHHDTVLSPTSRMYFGDMIKLRIQGVPDPIICTPDHKFLVVSGFDRYEWVEAQDLTKNQKICMVNEDRPEHQRFVEFTYENKKSGSVVFDLYDPETLWAIGLFLAEGSWGAERSGRRDSFLVTLNKSEAEYANRFSEWAKKLGGSVSITPAKKSRAVCVQVFGVVLTNAWISLMEGHKTAINKRIPALVRSLPEDCLRHVVRGYLDGDGSYQFAKVNHVKTGKYDSVKVTAASISHDLIEDFSDIYRRAGIHYTVHAKDYTVGKDGTHHKKAYYLTVTSYDRVFELWDWISGNLSIRRANGCSVSKVTSIEKQHYNGFVHCLSIKGDPSFSLAGGPIVHNCLVGAVKKWLLPDRVTKKVYPERAKKAYEMLRDIAGKDNFFVEIFPHKVTHEWVKPEYDKEGKMIKRGEFVPHDCTPWFPDGDYQKKANMFVYELAKSNGDPCIISLDSHFAYPDQKVVQDSKLGNGQENWRFYNSYHVMSSEESATCLKHTMGLEDKEIEQMIDNSYLWGSHFDNFKLKTKNDRWILPPLDSSWMSNLKEAINRHGRMKWNDPRYVSRLKEEMDLFTNNGRINLMPYFFTVEDIANFCRQSGILMTARGSAGGSLLLYVLGVSATDPIKYDLSLPRFLTLGRIQENTLPDVDMDFGRKDEVLQYLKSKYKDAFAPISIDSMLKLKSSIKDVERSVLGEVRQTTEDMCKKLPTSPQGSNEHEFVFGKDGHGGAIEEYPQLKKYAEENHTIWQTVSQMLGVQRQKSQHACYSGETMVYVVTDGFISTKRIDQCLNEKILTGQGNIADSFLLYQGMREVVEYTLENGEKILATPDHKMLTEQGWVEIDQVYKKGLNLVCPSLPASL